MKLQPGPIPLYYRLEQLLKERIERREFGPGDLLPTEEALCAAYGVSRITVRRALESLLAQRIIARRRGVGTFVAKESGAARSMRLMGSLDDLLTYPGRFSYRVLSRSEAPPPPRIASALGLADDVKAVRLEVIAFLENEPFAYSNFYFPEWVGAMIHKADTEPGLPIVRVIEKKINQRIVRAEQVVEPVLANAATARHLGIKTNAPLLEAIRTYYVGSGAPVEVAVVRYHPERYRYTMELVTQPI